ncbi:NYN domain-containing protein, partial [Staphylococcus aureus]
VECNLKYSITKKLLNGSIDLNDLKEKDFSLSLQQKGVDMKIGLDIASLSFKHQVDKIILIAGDSDFV